MFSIESKENTEQVNFNSVLEIEESMNLNLKNQYKSRNRELLKFL